METELMIYKKCVASDLYCAAPLS